MTLNPSDHVVIKKQIAQRVHVDQEAIIDRVHDNGILGLVCFKDGKRSGLLSFSPSELDKYATLNIVEWRTKQRTPKNYGW